MTDTFKERLHLSNDSIQTSDTSTSSSPRFSPNPQSKKLSDKRSQSCIKEVFDFNLKEELNVISELIDEYNYIGMDTEFPGTVYDIDMQNITDDFYYKSLKMNVDKLKLIQLGITLTDDKGKYPENIPYHTWQFNFEFDINKDKINKKSFNLLKKSGIDFNQLKSNGIKKQDFAANLMISGLVLNPDVHWISYQGMHDFGYILSLLLNEELPKDEDEFINALGIYFPNFYDVKMLIKDLSFLDGGLNKLMNKLGVPRKGIMHQAGSDSIATVESFLSLIKLSIVKDAKIKNFRNTLYGIGIGRDNENTINYIYSDMNDNNNIGNFIKSKNNNNSEEIKERNKCAYNMKQSSINNFSNFNSNNNCCTNNSINNNIKFNWFCPFMFFGNYGMMQNCNCNNCHGLMNQGNNNNCLMMPNCNEIMA